MREYGKISPTFWTGPTGKKIKKNGPEDISIALYLLSSPHSNMLGLYYLPIPFVAHETGIPFEGASKALRRVCEAGFCSYDYENEVVWVYEMAKYQIGELKPNDKRIVGIQKDYDNLPKNLFLKEFYEKYKEDFHLKKARAFEAPSKPLKSPIEAPSKPHRSQEQEQEQEQDIKRTAPPGPPPGGPSKHYEKKLPKHFIFDIDKACSDISGLKPKNGNNFNPWMFVQKQANENKHPQAIIDSLKGLCGLWDTVKDPWPFAQKIVATKSGNYREQEHIEQSEQFKLMVVESRNMKDLLRKIGAG